MVRFGGDLTPLGTSLRSLNAQVKAAGQKMKEDFKSSFGDLGSIISGGAILAGIKSVIDHFDEIDKRAKNLSISTDFLQGMEHIASKESASGADGFAKAIAQLSVNLGEAKNGISEYVEKFNRWGITLKDIQGMNTEQMFYKLADRIKDIPDPAQRSAAAFELLGKAGKDMAGIMANGSEDVKKMVDAVDKLDEQKIKDLANAKKTIEDTSNTATIFAGKALGGVASIARWLGKESMGPTMAGHQDAADWMAAHGPQAAAAATGPDKTQLAEQAAKLLDAKNKYLDALSAGGRDEDKMNGLVRQRHDLQAKINAIQGKSVEKYALMAQLAEKETAIRQLNAKIAKDEADKQKEADEKHQQKLKEEQTLTDDIRKTRNQLSQLGRERAADQRADYMPSLEELANSGYAVFRHNQMEFQQGPFAAMARQLLNLQSDAKQSLIWGDQDRFKQDVSRIDDLKKALASAGVMSPDDRLESIDDKIGETKNHMAELLAQAKGDGLIVRGNE
jgi:hypothetical protein